MKHSRRKGVWKTYYVIINSKRILNKEGGVQTDLLMREQRNLCKEALLAINEEPSADLQI